MKEKQLTALEWYEYMPEEVRDKAQAYHLERRIFNGIGDINETKKSLSNAISGGFLWDETTEGRDYWYHLYLIYQNFHP